MGESNTGRRDPRGEDERQATLDSRDEQGSARKDQDERRAVERSDGDSGRSVPLYRRPLLKMVGIGAVLGGGVQQALALLPSDSVGSTSTLAESAVARSIDTDGETVVVGASTTAESEESTELAAILTRTEAGWHSSALLTPRADSCGFGDAVAVDGDTVLVGASRDGDDQAYRAGSVAVYARSGTGWTRTGRLVPEAPSGMGQFGGTLALDGSRALVGAKTDSNEHGFRVGAVSLFGRAAGEWRQVATVYPDSDLERFGTAVALDGSTAVVGARRDGSSAVEAGVAVVLEEAGGEWTATGRLVPEATDRDDGFGRAVAVSGNSILVGAPRETNGVGDNAGAAYVFTRHGGSWRRTRRLLAPGGGSDDRFGATVDIDGERALVGAALGGDDRLETGAVHVFERDGHGWHHRGTKHDTAGRTTQRDPVVAVREETGVSVGEEGIDGSNAGLEVFDA